MVNPEPCNKMTRRQPFMAESVPFYPPIARCDRSTGPAFIQTNGLARNKQPVPAPVPAPSLQPIGVSWSCLALCCFVCGELTPRNRFDPKRKRHFLENLPHSCQASVTTWHWPLCCCLRGDPAWLGEDSRTRQLGHLKRSFETQGLPS